MFLLNENVRNRYIPPITLCIFLTALLSDLMYYALLFTVDDNVDPDVNSVLTNTLVWPTNSYLLYFIVLCGFCLSSITCNAFLKSAAFIPFQCLLVLCWLGYKLYHSIMWYNFVNSLYMNTGTCSTTFMDNSNSDSEDTVPITTYVSRMLFACLQIPVLFWSCVLLVVYVHLLISILKNDGTTLFAQNLQTQIVSFSHKHRTEHGNTATTSSAVHCIQPDVYTNTVQLKLDLENLNVLIPQRLLMAWCMSLTLVYYLTIVSLIIIQILSLVLNEINIGVNQSIVTSGIESINPTAQFLYFMTTLWLHGYTMWTATGQILWYISCVTSGIIILLSVLFLPVRYVTSVQNLRKTGNTPIYRPELSPIYASEFLPLFCINVMMIYIFCTIVTTTLLMTVYTGYNLLAAYNLYVIAYAGGYLVLLMMQRGCQRCITKQYSISAQKYPACSSALYNLYDMLMIVSMFLYGWIYCMLRISACFMTFLIHVTVFQNTEVHFKAVGVLSLIFDAQHRAFIALLQYTEHNYGLWIPIPSIASSPKHAN